ncbi:LysR family transcriptional regulator [Streptococcus agalactiae]|uniref:LysR family transcriptional regulator n=1 Tax=Streptococcus agalactiae TaxID=1311 RepID=UPI0024B93888|nr:LysR family transcriptional regulator [Streptococcus agalactiae]
METLQKINFLEAIDSCESLTKAAKHLFISQPYLSKVIKQMEKQLDISLIHNHHTGNQLSYAGKRYLYYLKEIHRLENKITDEIYLIRSHQQGELFLGINSGLASFFLAKFIPHFQSANPKIDLNLIENNQNITEKMLLLEQIDLAIGMSPLVSKNELSTIPIYKEKIYLLVPQQSSLFSNQQAGKINYFHYSYNKLETEPIIITPLEYGLGNLICSFYKNHYININSILTTSTVPTDINLSLAGAGSTFIPESLISSLPSNKSYNLYKFEDTYLFAEYILIYNKNKNLSPITLKLLHTIQEEIAK